MKISWGTPPTLVHSAYWKHELRKHVCHRVHLVAAPGMIILWLSPAEVVWLDVDTFKMNQTWEYGHGSEIVAVGNCQGPPGLRRRSNMSGILNVFDVSWQRNVQLSHSLVRTS